VLSSVAVTWITLLQLPSAVDGTVKVELLFVSEAHSASVPQMTTAGPLLMVYETLAIGGGGSPPGVAGVSTTLRLNVVDQPFQGVFFRDSSSKRAVET
jgi:hypothetical protein